MKGNNRPLRHLTPTAPHDAAPLNWPSLAPLFSPLDPFNRLFNRVFGTESPSRFNIRANMFFLSLLAISWWPCIYMPISNCLECHLCIIIVKQCINLNCLRSLTFVHLVDSPVRTSCGHQPSEKMKKEGMVSVIVYLPRAWCCTVQQQQQR